MSPSWIEIGGVLFKSKTAAAEHARMILRECEEGDLPDQHIRFAFALLKLHPNFAEKEGTGLTWIRVETEPIYKTRCFYAVRRDGTKVDFSYRQGLFPSTSRADVLSAMRWEVNQDVRRWKIDAIRELVGTPCPVTGLPLTMEESDADHVPPDTFIALAEAWAKSHGRTLESVGVAHSDGGQHFQDRNLAGDWRDFHRARMRLQLLHREGHVLETSRRRAG